MVYYKSDGEPDALRPTSAKFFLSQKTIPGVIHNACQAAEPFKLKEGPWRQHAAGWGYLAEKREGKQGVQRLMASKGLTPEQNLPFKSFCVIIE